MSGYRVALEPEDPFGVDEALARSQRFNQRLLLHGILTVCTIGFWLPVLFGWLALSSSSLKKFSSGYAVTIRGGMLIAGNSQESRSVPLDAVADVAIKSGYVTVSVRGAQPLQLYGLRDPQAAARAILEARAEHVRGVRVDVREEVLNAEVGPGVPQQRRQA
jgi:hypothetical protein